jgi:hypothetical protein
MATLSFIAYTIYPIPVLFALMGLLMRAHSLLYWGTILFMCAAATCAMLAWTFCYAGFVFNTKVLEDLRIPNRHCGPHPNCDHVSVLFSSHVSSSY